MKCNWKFLPIICLLIAFVPAHASTTDHGVCRVGKTKIDSLTCYGPAILNGTTVTGDLVINGPLTLQNANVQNVKVTELANIINSIVNRNVNVVGYLSLSDSKINGDIDVINNKIDLNNTIVTGMVRMTSSKQDTIFILRGKSEIQKDVKFVESPGIVEIHDQAKIIGKVINGTVKKISS